MAKLFVRYSTCSELIMMLRRALVCLAVLSAAGEAATSGFLLGMDYSETAADPLALIVWAPIAADAAGELYIQSTCTISGVVSACITKLSADGQTILWQQTGAGFPSTMAVDPSGAIYLAWGSQSASPFVVEKLSPDGATVVWKTPIPGSALVDGSARGDPSLAVDSSGRAFVVCDAATGAVVARLNAAGAVDFTLHVPVKPLAIAVDPTGSDIVVAVGGGIARLASDGITWIDIDLPQPIVAPPLTLLPNPALAVAANGDAVIYGSVPNGAWVLQRIDPAGAVVFSKAFPAGSQGGLALDAAGDAYITGYTGSALYAVRNSLAPCGATWLSVYAPDGSVLQTTYLPGAGVTGSPAYIAVDADSAVHVLSAVPSTAAPTRTGPFGAAAPDTLYRFSPNANAQTLSLACIGNGGSFLTGPVAPGEIVSLFGNGLGPQQGVQPATTQNPYPTQAAGVEVTFGGTPAPLLWVQDAQINAAVPWSLTGATTEVCVTYSNAQSNCLALPVAQVSPGVFTMDGIHAAAVNQDGTPNSAANPAPLSSAVSVFGTGLGPFSAAPLESSLEGLPIPVNAPVGLETGCPSAYDCPTPISYNTIYAGPAPSQAAGLSRIDFKASDAVLNDGLVPLYLTLQTQSGLALSNPFQIYVTGQ